MSEIMNELLKVAGIKPPKGGVPDQPFLQRLRKHAEAVFDEDEDKWEKLSKEAQSWHNEANKAVTDKTDIPQFSDLADPDKAEQPAEVDEGVDEPAEAGEEEVAKPAKKGAVKKAAPAKKAAAEKPAAKKAAAAPAKKAAPAGSGEKPKKSMLKALREFVCKKPELTTEQLVGKLESAGYKVSAMTVGTLRSDCRNTLKIAQECGVVLKDLDFDA